MLLVWYKNNSPIYSFDARINNQWSNTFYNTSNRMKIDLKQQPTALTVTSLRGDDQALYHCRVDYLLAPTRNIGVNLTVIILPSRPFFLDELGNKVDSKIGPYHEGDTLVLSCLVIGGRPAPKISWYSGEDLIDASDGESDIPGVKENELYLPLTRCNAEALSCQAVNTPLTQPVIATLQIEIYLAAFNVSINWVHGTVEDTLQFGVPVVVKCVAHGSYPPPELSWWLDHRHLTQHSNQSWNNETRSAESYLQLTPAVSDDGATLACVATNTNMPPGRDSRADLTVVNVTYSPVVEISKKGDGRLNEVSELDSLYLECEAKANPPVNIYKWFYNDLKIGADSLWGSKTSSHTLFVDEMTRELGGRYSCSAKNSIGETRSETINITVLYPPECIDQGIILFGETLQCLIRAVPPPDTYFWHFQAAEGEVQHLTSGSANLPLSQINGSLATTLAASCKVVNGIASQDKACLGKFHFENLRPPRPRQCDIAYEYEEFQMTCIPVENATYYEVSVWRLSTSNSSLMLERRGSMGYGMSQALALGSGAPRLMRGALGALRAGDEAGAAACNRYGCSTTLLLTPTEKLLENASISWWKFLTERDFGISLGVILLVAVFILSSWMAVRLARRAQAKRAPIVQLTQLDNIARNHLDSIGEQKVRASKCLRVCSSRYSDGFMESVPTIDRRRKSRLLWNNLPPPPDITLTQSRESDV